MTTAQKIRKAYRLAKLIKQCEESRKELLASVASEAGFTLGSCDGATYGQHETCKVSGGEHTLSVERGLSSTLDRKALVALGVSAETLDAATKISYFLKAVVR